MEQVEETLNAFGVWDETSCSDTKYLSLTEGLMKKYKENNTNFKAWMKKWKIGSDQLFKTSDDLLLSHIIPSELVKFHLWETFNRTNDCNSGECPTKLPFRVIIMDSHQPFDKKKTVPSSYEPHLEACIMMGGLLVRLDKSGIISIEETLLGYHHHLEGDRESFRKMNSVSFVVMNDLVHTYNDPESLKIALERFANFTSYWNGKSGSGFQNSALYVMSLLKLLGLWSETNESYSFLNSMVAHKPLPQKVTLNHCYLENDFPTSEFEGPMMMEYPELLGAIKNRNEEIPFVYEFKSRKEIEYLLKVIYSPEHEFPAQIETQHLLRAILLTNYSDVSPKSEVWKYCFWKNDRPTQHASRQYDSLVPIETCIGCECPSTSQLKDLIHKYI